MLLVLFQIKIGARMNSFQFFKPKREIKLNIAGSVCVVCKFNVVMKTVFVFAKPQTLVPVHSCFFPFVVPFHFCSGADKELHFHLFELAHAENKLPRYYFIPESFSCLCDTERK